MSISVFLVDDHAPFRSYLRQLLEAQPDLTVVGEAASGDEALAAARLLAPEPLADVMLLDVAMRGLSGIELARQLRRLAPRARLLALSLHDDAIVVDAMLAAGADGYLLKSDPLDKLLSAVRGAAARPHDPRL